MKIKSKTDVITNSSTEVFTIIDENLVIRLQKLVDELLGPGASNRFEFKFDFTSTLDNLNKQEVESLNDFMRDNKITPRDLEEFSEMITTGPRYEMLKNWFLHYGSYEDGFRYPNLRVISKDPRDAKIAKAIERIPWISEHTAYYC